MKDHQPLPGGTARYLALRARRQRLLLPAATRSLRADPKLNAPIVHGTYNGGLRRDQLLGDFATVQVTVGPWDYIDMTDIIVLHWGDQWTQEFAVKNTNGAQLLAIPGVDIAGDPLGDGDHYSGEGLHAVWYEVRTLSGDVPSSFSTEVIVKTARPGGQDPLPDTPVNDNLKPPTAEPNPVEQGTTQVVFSVQPWKNIGGADRLTLVLGGYRFDFPAISDTTAIQKLTLTAEQIAAIDGGPKTPVTYEVTDAVGNRSGYAPYLLLDIWLESGDLLEMIELLDAKLSPIAGAIDPSMTEGRARVPRYLGWQTGESVTVVLEGVDSNEQPHTTTLGPVTWASEYYLDFPLPGDALMTLAGGVVRVHYETSADKYSHRRLYVVDALPEVGLPPVTVIGEQGGELALGTIGDYVSIVVPDSEALVDFARITLVMEGTGKNGPVREEETHNVGGGEGHRPYTFSWDKKRVEPLLDHTATFSYSVRTLDAGRTALPARPRLYRPLGIRESEPHDLLIRQTAAPGQLAAPTVHDLVDGAVAPTLPKLRLTVPGGIASVPGAEVITTVAGLTTASRTDLIFDEGEDITVDFPGWPVLNDGGAAKAWYAIGDKVSQEATFKVGDASPFSIDDSLIEIVGLGESRTRNASGGTPPYTYTSNVPEVVSVPDPNQGGIRSILKGTALITAKDSASGVGSYPVFVSSGTPPFYIDPSSYGLIGVESYTRNATGGTPPYTYTSGNPGIVVVPNPNYGEIRSVSNGRTTITARDSDGAMASYPVSVIEVSDPFAIDASQVTLTGAMNYSRNATGGKPPYTYTSNQPGVVAIANAGIGEIHSVANGDAIITARDSAQGVGTYPVHVSGFAPPLNDVTDFANYNWNGWEKGTAGMHSLCTIVFEQGNYRLRNISPGNFNNVGVLIGKMFSNLVVGKTYMVGLSFLTLKDAGPSAPVPTLSISTTDRVIYGPQVMSANGWFVVQATFVAVATSTRISLYNHQAASLGNDCEIDNIHVVQL